MPITATVFGSLDFTGFSRAVYLCVSAALRRNVLGLAVGCKKALSSRKVLSLKREMVALKRFDFHGSAEKPLLGYRVPGWTLSH